MPAPFPPAAPRRSVARGCFGAALGLLGVVLVLGGGALAAAGYRNHQRAETNTTAYYPVMWRNEKTETIFPATLSGGANSSDPDAPATVPSDAERAQWHRLGVSPETSCDKGLTGTMKQAVLKQGCTAVLRATYVDPSAGTVATVALIVLATADGDTQKLRDDLAEQQRQEHPDDVVHAYAVPGTAAAHWTDAGRNGMASDSSLDGKPYLIAVATGATDARVAGKLPGAWGARDAEHDGESDRSSWMSSAADISSMFGKSLSSIKLKDDE
ncbi:hypothetical protein [Streptomyces sp. NPDC050738]|uniref:hypothetical protein n=1 Tax=Streptomyces sp. NPDC050738 TaxID=3154744 RepID=UPI00343C8DF4